MVFSKNGLQVETPVCVFYVLCTVVKSVSSSRMDHWTDKEESLCFVPGRFWLQETLGKLVPDPADGWRLELPVAPRAGQTRRRSGVESWERERERVLTFPAQSLPCSYQHWRILLLWSRPDSPPGHEVSATPWEDTAVGKERKSTCTPVCWPRQVRLWWMYFSLVTNRDNSQLAFTFQ